MPVHFKYSKLLINRLFEKYVVYIFYFRCSISNLKNNLIYSIVNYYCLNTRKKYYRYAKRLNDTNNPRIYTNLYYKNTNYAGNANKIK